MLPKTKSVLVALLLAYRALAVPTSYDQQDQVQSVIDEIKAQMKADDLRLSTFYPLIDDVEANLKEHGVLDAEHVAALNQEIEVSRYPQYFTISLYPCHAFFQTPYISC